MNVKGKNTDGNKKKNLLSVKKEKKKEKPDLYILPLCRKHFAFPLSPGVCPNKILLRAATDSDVYYCFPRDTLTTQDTPH